MMIDDRESNDSDDEQGLNVLCLSKENSPRHNRYKPIEISEILSDHDSTHSDEAEHQEHLPLPSPRIVRSGRSASLAVAKWKTQKSASIDYLTGSTPDSMQSIDYEDAEFDECTPLQKKQLYLLVARCIAFPFNAKFQMETAPTKPRLNSSSYINICKVLQGCSELDKDLLQHLILKGNEQKCIRNSDFTSSIEWYLSNILSRDDVRNACIKGAISTKELEHVFRIYITRKFRSGDVVPEVSIKEKSTKKYDNDPKFSAWMTTFAKLVELGHQHSLTDKEKMKVDKQINSLQKDDMYAMFQSILGVTRAEHQALFRACNLNNPEEQEDVARREISRRKEQLRKEECPPIWKHQSRIIKSRYFQEMTKRLAILADNLHQRQGSTASTDIVKKKNRQNVNETETFSKNDLVYHHKIKVTIRDASNIIGINEGKKIFIVFDVVDGNSPLATNKVELTNTRIVLYDESGEFRTDSPLPQLKFMLKTDTQGFLNNEKLLARKIYDVMPTATETIDVVNLERNDGTVLANLRISTFLERPSNMRKCGKLYCNGDFALKTWKLRFIALIQLNQFNFALCYYQPKDIQPKEFINLTGFTVGYLNEEQLIKENSEGKYHFILSSESGVIKFGCVTSTEREQWVQWLTRATGQTDKPLEHRDNLGGGELDRLGLAEVVNMDVTELDHPKLFNLLFKAVLKYRLNELDFSRGFFSPSQMYLIDEYCARYCIRLSHRHLTCLWEWLQMELKGWTIWPVMLLHSFGFYQMNVFENKFMPQEFRELVTAEENIQWIELSGQIEQYLTEKLENFRSQFPFSCPKDDLKVVIKLFILVTEINHADDSKLCMTLLTDKKPLQLLNNVMERAALVNYTHIHSNMSNYEEFDGFTDGSLLNAEQLYVLAQLCIDFMYELHEFYAEDFTLYPLALAAHIDAFWSFYEVDLQECLHNTEDAISLLKIFYMLNEYFCSQPVMKLNKFHQNLLTSFEPLVDRYLTNLDVKLSTDLTVSFYQETWLPVCGCCQSMQGCLESLDSIKGFITDLSWPQDPFRSELISKVQSICASKFQEGVKFSLHECTLSVQNCKMTLNSLLPKPIITMVNTVLYLSLQVPSFCGLTHIDDVPEEQLTTVLQLTSFLEESISEMLSSVINKLCEPLVIILLQLSKFDPSINLLSSLKKIMPNKLAISQYGQYLKQNVEHLAMTLVAPAYVNFILNWYETQMIMINDWLTRRPDFSLHQSQLNSIDEILLNIRQEFIAEDIGEEQLDTENYQQIEDRVRKEHSAGQLVQT